MTRRERQTRRDLIISWVLFVVLTTSTGVVFHHQRQVWLAELEQIHQRSHAVATR